MVYSCYKKQRILYHHSTGNKAPTIAKLLREEGLKCSRVGVARFLKRFSETGTIRRCVGSGRPSKVTAAIKSFVDDQMRLDDETTAVQLYRMLTDKDYRISLRTVLCCRSSLGWMFRGRAYCQHISEANKVKRLAWTHEYLTDTFDDVIWTDECTVQMESHWRFCCRRRGEPPKPKPRHKHPTKVHVWAGISLKGRTGICIFEGIMKKELYVEILRETLLPFIRDSCPTGHKFMQDNDPKHTSRLAKSWFEENDVNWWKTLAESPDLKPNENMWHELNEYIRREAKPTTKDQLVSGIAAFWNTVRLQKCTKYIRHLRKVVPKVIEMEGAATGY